MEQAIYNYLANLKAIQDYQADTGDISTPYALEMRRQALHEELVSTYTALCLDDDLVSVFDVYDKSKIVFGNLDKICEIYSSCEEWKLKDNSDVRTMAKYLDKFLSSSEVKNYFERGFIPHVFRGIENPFADRTPDEWERDYPGLSNNNSKT